MAFGFVSLQSSSRLGVQRRTGQVLPLVAHHLIEMVFHRCPDYSNRGIMPSVPNMNLAGLMMMDGCPGDTIHRHPLHYGWRSLKLVPIGCHWFIGCQDSIGFNCSPHYCIPFCISRTNLRLFSVI